MPSRCASLLIALVALSAGCGGSTITGSSSEARARDYSPSDRIRVMFPPAGPANEAAGHLVSARVIEVLQQTHGDVALVATADPQEAIAAARTAKAAFLVEPTILEWTDTHAPPVTADRVRVRLDLLDPNAGDVVSSVTFENSSGLLAVTDERPEALLDKSFDRSVALLITTGPTGREAVRQAGPKALENVPVDQQKYPRQ
jgi:hypothetical protein